MSRWRETLCGKMIPTAQPVDQNTMAGSSEVLSCGGVFVPQVRQKGGVLKRERTVVFFLPKGNHELLVMNPGSDPIRYRADSDPDHGQFEVLEEALAQIDLKIVK